MSILTQFIFRVSFGLALGMVITPAKQVTSGYYRNHLYVLLGLNALATLVALSAPERFAYWPPLATAIASYVGAVCWLYERPKLGVAALVAVAGLAITGAWMATDWPATDHAALQTLVALDPVTGGLVLGLTLAAMFLGHWYLNTPTMAIGPLARLVLLMGVAIVLRMAVSAAGITYCVSHNGAPALAQISFLALRWLAGLISALALTWMTYATLKIPNTQSATGILYVAVIVTFIGELTSLLLSAEMACPV